MKLVGIEANKEEKEQKQSQNYEWYNEGGDSAAEQFDSTFATPYVGKIEVKRWHQEHGPVKVIKTARHAKQKSTR